MSPQDVSSDSDTGFDLGPVIHTDGKQYGFFTDRHEPRGGSWVYADTQMVVPEALAQTLDLAYRPVEAGFRKTVQ